jgi:hypothetical protein
MKRIALIIALLLALIASPVEAGRKYYFSVSVNEALTYPRLINKPVDIIGTYQGLSPLVTRSDWILRDGTGEITISGVTLNQEVGQRVQVKGIITGANGQRYIRVIGR